MNTIGIDVSKAKIDCAWLIEEGKLKFKVLPNTKAGCNELIEWSLKSTSSLEITQLHFIMEATGVYHEQLAIQLHNAAFYWLELVSKYLFQWSKNQFRLYSRLSWARYRSIEYSPCNR